MFKTKRAKRERRLLYSATNRKNLLTWCCLKQRYILLLAPHIINILKSATIIQYTIKGRFMSR